MPASQNLLKNHGVLGIVLGLLSSSLYGITPIFVYHAFDYGADPFGLMTSRYIIASVVLLAVRTMRFGFTRWPTRKTSLQLFSLGAIGLYANSVCMFNALKYLPSGLSMVIFYFYPIVVVLFGWALYKHTPPKIIWPCLATTIIGVILSASDVSGGQMKGVIFIVVGAFAYAFYSVLAGAVMPRAELTTGLLLVFAGAACSFSLVWFVDPHGLPTTMPYVADVWLPALEIGLVGTIGAMGIFFCGHEPHRCEQECRHPDMGSLGRRSHRNALSQSTIHQPPSAWRSADLGRCVATHPRRDQTRRCFAPICTRLMAPQSLILIGT